MFQALYITARDFNIDELQESVLQKIPVGYSQFVKEPTNIGDALLDHIYVKNTLHKYIYIYIYIYIHAIHAIIRYSNYSTWF